LLILFSQNQDLSKMGTQTKRLKNTKAGSVVGELCLHNHTRFPLSRIEGAAALAEIEIVLSNVFTPTRKTLDF